MTTVEEIEIQILNYRKKLIELRRTKNERDPEIIKIGYRIAMLINEKRDIQDEQRKSK